MLIAVAGPYSADTEEKRKLNLKAMNSAAARVYLKGHIPVIGINTSLFVADELDNSLRQEALNKISFAVVEKCDAILMIGSSPGADTERRIIEAKGLPVYYSIDEIPEHNKAL
jgi:hypothetical protein